MTPEEKKLIKEEIIKELEERYKGIVVKEDTGSVLAEVRNKWFTGRNESKATPMFDLFGCVVYWTVWELVRKLTCIICGCGYVRHLREHTEANEIAERLCQTIYELRIQYKEKNK